MTGIVTTAREAELPLVVQGPYGDQEAATTIVDTGFDGFLTLSSASVAALRLVFHSPILGTLADGSVVTLRQFEAVVTWEGRDRDILVLEADGGPLVGMSLLDGCRLTMDIVPGGPVTIQPLP